MSSHHLFLRELWKVIHILGYCWDKGVFEKNTQGRENFLCFFDTLKHLIPDNESKYNYTDFIYHIPLDKSLNNAFRWTVKLHNHINLFRRRRGQISPDLTEEQAFKIYDTLLKDGKNSWGPSFWKVIHYFAANIPEQLNQRDPEINYMSSNTRVVDIYKVFIETLQYVLPCEKCRQHLKDNLLTLNINESLTDNNSLFLWSIKLHNLVNTQLGKPVINDNRLLNDAWNFYHIKKSSYEFIPQ